ncbi:MAG: ubiquinol cytochrome C oxidoreductase [Bacteroidota bacterium]
MVNLTAVRPSNLLYNVLITIVGFTFMLTWLPLLRCMFDGNSYSWGTFYFGKSFQSVGLQPDYLLNVFSLLIFMALYYGFYHLKNRKVFYGLLGLWFIHIFGNFLLEIALKGDVVFHGDTMGVQVSLLTIVLPLAILALVLIGLVIKHDLQTEPKQIPWSRLNTIKALLILGPLPLQAIFFATGEPHDMTDQIAVVIAIIQSIVMGWIFVPGKDFPKH